MDLGVRLATAADAPAIARLARRCYGETYPDQAALDPEHVARLIASGQVTYSVAVSPEGCHAGHVALEAKGEHGLFEHGRAVVDEPFRGQGLMAAMSEVLFREHAPRVGARVVMGRSVTNHLFTQRYNFAAGFRPLGLLLGALRAGFSASGIGESPEPVSILLMGLPMDPSPRPRRLTLEGEDHRRCAAVLRSLGIPATRRRARRDDAPLGGDVQVVESMGLRHVRLSAGLPSRQRPEELVAEAADGGRLAWVDVPVEHPRAAEVVSGLRATGFGHAAVIPLAGPDGEDVLRLQRYQDPLPLTPAQIHLLPQAKAVLDDVLSDAAVMALA